MYTTNYKISFSQTDPGGILFFAEFFNIAHIVYELFFENLNLDRNYFLDEKYILPIVHAEADYLSPLRYGDELKCTVTVDSIGETSFQLRYTLENNGKRAAEIITKHVAVLKREFSKVSLPEDLRKKLKENRR